jgi:arylsulfatase A-like enzyme
LDQMRRLDQRLGAFLDRVQAGGRTVAIAFSADHGGLDFVERLQDQGIPAKRLDTDAWMQDLQSRVRAELHLDKDLLIAGNDHFPNEIYFVPDLARQLGDRKTWVEKVVKIVRAMPDIAVASSFEELAALPNKRFDDPRQESLLYRLKYSAAPDRAGEILFAFQPMIELGAPPDHDPAQHGTAYDYDRRVPIIFWGPWLAERRHEPATTVDIAPTLAQELGITPEEPLDGLPIKLSHRNHD